MNMKRQNSKRAFTLVELLVVLFIVGLVSAATLPVLLPTLNQRQVQEGARIVQQALINARFAAMSSGRPAGVRLMPDPIYNGPDATDLLRPLAYNRMVQLEPAPDYSDGQLRIHSSGATTAEIIGFFQYCIAQNLNWQNLLIGSPNNQPNTLVSKGPQDPYLNQLSATKYKDPRIVLRQYKSETATGMNPSPVEPTSWSWNVRAGDRITVGTQNTHQYVIAGPIAPLNLTSGYNATTYNPERFINMGNPNLMTQFQLPTYYAKPVSPTPSLYYSSEILFVVNEENRMFNNIDDNGDGVIDPAYEGVDNNGKGFIDDPTEIFYNSNGIDPQVNVVYPMLQSGITDPKLIYEALVVAFEWEPCVLSLGSGNSVPQEYTIKRRMVPSANSAEVGLPADVVIDATTALGWDSANARPLLAPPNVNYSSAMGMAERSRVPIDPYTRFVDIIFQPDGQVVTSTASSVNNAPFQVPYYHLWLTDRADVFTPTDPNQAGSKIYTPRLPLSSGTPLQSQHMNVNNADWALKNERRLITIQTRTGRITSQTAELFDPNETSLPYQDAQKGVAEVGQ